MSPRSVPPDAERCIATTWEGERCRNRRRRDLDADVCRVHLDSVVLDVVRAAEDALVIGDADPRSVEAAARRSRARLDELGRTIEGFGCALERSRERARWERERSRPANS